VTDALYERYKDALRRGHVAALRGRPDESIAAYEEAAALAPDRPLAHTSRGAVLLRAGRLDEAIVAFAAALRIAPRDEVALTGRAEALAKARRRVDAAEAFDVLAVIQETAGRLAEACDTARRALEQAESKARRRHVESLTKTLSQTIGDRDAEVSLARALRVLEGNVPVTVARPIRPLSAAAPGAASAPGAARAPDGEAGATLAYGPEPESEPDAGPAPDAGELAREADEALRTGDLATARDRLLAAARAHEAAGRYVAALDACQEALAFAPSDPDLHLALVDVYVARGWHGPATEKLLLLGRLIELDGNTAARERFCRVVRQRFPDDERLMAMCA
jgi:tetratricopeptide (TPR) repeat protein